MDFRPRPCHWCGMPSVVDGSQTAAVLDLLNDEGGWWDYLAIATQLDLPASSVQKTLHRLKPWLQVRPDPNSSNARPRNQYRLAI